MTQRNGRDELSSMQRRSNLSLPVCDPGTTGGQVNAQPSRVGSVQTDYSFREFAPSTNLLILRKKI